MKLQVPAQMAGVTGPCPQCSASISAPQPGAQAMAAAPAAQELPTSPIPQQPAPQAQQPAPQAQQPRPAQQPQQAVTPRQPAPPQPLQSAPPQQQAVAPNPLQQSPTSPPRDNPPARSEQPPQQPPRSESPSHQQPQKEAPSAHERPHQRDEKPSPSPTPKPRARWMRVIFPLAFLVVAAALVLAVLQAVGVVNVWEYEKSQGELISTTSPNKTDKSGGQPVTGDTPEPVSPPTIPDLDPTSNEPELPSVPVIKDTHEDGEFPELKIPPAPASSTGAARTTGATNSTAQPTESTGPPNPPTPPAVVTSNPPPNPTTATQPDPLSSPPKAGFLANENLNMFLAAKTLDERMGLMSKSRHTREELMASCLAGPLKAVKSVRMVEMVPRAEDNMTQYLYFVSFEDAEEDRQRHRIVMQVVERPGTHPPRIHADAFIEHYEKKFTTYAKHPNNDVITFHCIAEARTADLSKDLPKEIKKSMVRLVIKSHPHGASMFDAYLNKNSPLMEKIGPRKDFPYTEARFCVLSFRWNTTDPNYPYIELNDIVSQGWER